MAKKPNSPIKKIFEKPVKPEAGGTRTVEKELSNTGKVLTVATLRERLNQLGPEFDDCKVQSYNDSYYSYQSIVNLRIVGKLEVTRQLHEKEMAEYEAKLDIYKKSLLDELQEVSAEEML